MLIFGSPGRTRTADKVVNSRIGGRGELNKLITCIACHFRFLSKYAVFLGHPITDWYKSGTRCGRFQSVSDYLGNST